MFNFNIPAVMTEHPLKIHRGSSLFLTVTIIFGLFCELHATKDIKFLDSRQAELVRQLRSYEISIPWKVTQDGNFLSHQLTHHVSHRHVRSISKQSQNTLHYKLTLNNEEIHMQVVPNHRLYGPGTVIERRKGKFQNVSDSEIRRIHDKMCYFVGEIKGHPGSKVALSTCNGLRGFIQSKHGQHFIEPVVGHTNAEGQQPHLLYEGAALPEHLGGRDYNEDDKKNSSCGVKDNENEDAERLRWEREVRGNVVNHHRRKRSSYSLERNVETLVVVDDKMMEFYQKENVETYILTIMNMVAVIYHDSSIGNAVNVVLVRLILLEEEEDDLKISHHADHTLNSFCKWQSRINPKEDKHPTHHDVAVLLTRFNICSRKNQPCSTLGLAQVSGMCQPHRSCNINEDTGLALAYTIAHELGHNFGMKHDGPSNSCEAPYGIRQHVMSPQLVSDSSPLVWSNCSRDAITKFLDRDWGYCLEDEPGDHDFEYPIIPPGAMYDADHQCRLQYGATATHCDGIEEVCTTLWCKVDNKCMTRLEAAAEGTYCDKKNKNMWCFRGECTTIGERAQAINGEWGEWSGWASCTRTCGAGVSHAERLCNNPMPGNGGKYCLGERKRFRICNTKGCPPEAPSYRHYQCSEFNTVPYKNRLFTWEPVFTPSTPCQLHCKPKEKFFSVMLKDMVTDGTSCAVGKRDMCISGKCRRVGCDWTIDSKAKEDRCGMCHGDGSTCLTVKKEFTEKQGLGYVEATVIPKDARNIRIEEVAEANNYLALRNSDGKYYLNGHWFIQWSGDYEAAGTVFHYERNGNKEKVFAPGPLKEQLHIMLLFQSQNPGVEFEYTVPNENATVRRPFFMWKFTDWSHCTVSCGGGIQRMAVYCVEQEAGIVEDHYCHMIPKPDDKIKACNDHICPAMWWIGPWQHCSVTCGDGTHRRTVICVRSLGPDQQMALDDEDCEGLSRPIETEPCRHRAQCPEWKVGEWTDECHGDPCASQHRTVECSDKELGCDTYTKPSIVRQCGNIHCGVWTSGGWSNCTQPCGIGIQFRRVKCTGGNLCRFDKKPNSQRLCNEFPCPENKMLITTTPAGHDNEVLRSYMLGTQSDAALAEKDNSTDEGMVEEGQEYAVVHPVTLAEMIGVTSSTPEEKIAETSGENEEDENLSNHIQIEALTTLKPRSRGKSWEDMDTKLEKLNTVEKKPVSTHESSEPATKKHHPRRHHHGRRRHRHHRHKKTSTTKATSTTTARTPVPTASKTQAELTPELVWTTKPSGTTEAPSIERTEKYLTEIPVLQTTDLSQKTTILIPEEVDRQSTNVGAEAAKSLQLNIEMSEDVTDNNWDLSETITSPTNRDSSQNKIEPTEKAMTSHTKTDILASKPTEDKYNVEVNIKSFAEKSDDSRKKYLVSSKSVVENKDTSNKETDNDEKIGYKKVADSMPMTDNDKEPYYKNSADSVPLKEVYEDLDLGKVEEDVVLPADDVEDQGEMDSAIPASEVASEVKLTKPPPLEEPYKWIPLYWSQCTRHCGGGIMTRKVLCVETKTTNEVPSANCYKLEKPTDISKCNEHPCIAWAVSDWSPCSKTCGGGQQARHVQCVNQTSYEPVVGCDDSLKPLTRQQCNTDVCAVQNAALMDWHHSFHCTSNQMSSHVCTILKRLGHCSQRYVQVKCCRTCRPHKKSKKHFVTA
ncbi:A disintegrin and metalloproteinase with thrombospondin motifs 12-like isoform X2 [Lineus longissimus]|uniref:A disintegrin and metalloproteinase with thrombospondin motifs 12-like isoform X2 n=1 Tax=Lineus longissimus TaxID=88925 RepID=UPI00315CB754